MKSYLCFSHYSVSRYAYSDFQSIQNLIDELDKVINSFKNFSSRKIIFTSDFIYGGQNSISDNLFNIFDGDTIAIGAYQGMFYNKWAGSSECSCEITKDDTDTLINRINDNFKTVEEYYIGYSLDRKALWHGLDPQFFKYSIFDVYLFDCDILKKYPINHESFYVRLKNIFNKLNFSDDCLDSLNTLPQKYYCLYYPKIVDILSICQLYTDELSINSNNKSDLNHLASLSGVECTVQGKSKGFIFNRNFTINNNVLSIMCEYHFKPFGVKQPHRIYFGLKILNNKKYICIGHIGGHL